MEIRDSGLKVIINWIIPRVIVAIENMILVTIVCISLRLKVLST